MKKLPFQPFPTLSTPRLSLRELNDRDAPDLSRLRSDEQVNKYLNRPSATTDVEAYQFIEKIHKAIARNESGYWVIALKPSSQLIGTICLWNFDLMNKTAELGFELLPSFQGKGMMHEAIECVIQFGFKQCDIKMITAFTEINNLRSIRALEKQGFQRDEHSNHSRDPELKGMLGYFLKRK